MSGDKISGTFKRCRSAINVSDPVLRKIACEINLAECLLVQYLEEVSRGRELSITSSQSNALDHLSGLVTRELRYLRKVKASQVVNVTGSIVTFKSDDGEFIVTLVPEEDLQKNFQPLFCFQNVRPRFAKPVVGLDNFPGPSTSAESVYYDACCDLPVETSDLPSGTSKMGRSIYGLLKYIFATTIGKLETENS